MHTFLYHLQQSAEAAYPGTDKQSIQYKQFYVSQFRNSQDDGQSWFSYPVPFATSKTTTQAVVLQKIDSFFKDQLFSTGNGPDYTTGRVEASFEKDFEVGTSFLSDLRFGSQKISLKFRVRAKVDKDGSTTIETNREIETWVHEFTTEIQARLADTQKPPDITDYPHNPVLAPGEEIRTPFTGNLKDYSGCATEEEIETLYKEAGGVLPLGQYAFDFNFGKKPRDPKGVITQDEALKLAEQFIANTAKIDLSGYTLSDRGSESKPEWKNRKDHYFVWRRSGYSGSEFRIKVDIAGTQVASCLYHGRNLLLGRYRTTARMEYNGTLICAPQNSGKTQLVLRWAEAANRAGYSSFIIDVKGNMLSKLKGRLAGNIYYFTTRPSPKTGRDEEWDRINFLAGIEPDDNKPIEQLVKAIVPSDGNETGDSLYYYQNRCTWLGGILHILKLHEYYFKESKYKGRGVDLSDLYNLVTGEQLLYQCIKEIKEAEEKTPPNDRIKPVNFWVNKITIMISQKEKDLGGQRSEKESYKQLTQGMSIALEPFSDTGVLYERIKDQGPGRLFRLEQLGEKEQVTIILAAREQDLEDSVTTVSMAVKRLQQFLFDRMEAKDPRPVLLLLDETRRIRSFKPNEYVTFAREAKAGCVVCYQSLSQCGDEKAVMELLENMGTQIFLGGMSGQSAKYFMSVLPKRFRQTYTMSVSSGSGAPSTTANVAQIQEDYLTTNELYRFPSGDWPALIYIRDHESKKPFLVDMDESALPAAPPPAVAQQQAAKPVQKKDDPKPVPATVGWNPWG